MPTKKPTPDDSEQSKRFIEIAEEVEATDQQALERALKKIISSTFPSQPAAKRRDPEIR